MKLSAKEQSEFNQKTADLLAEIVFVINTSTPIREDVKARLYAQATMLSGLLTP